MYVVGAISKVAHLLHQPHPQRMLQDERQTHEVSAIASSLPQIVVLRDREAIRKLLAEFSEGRISEKPRNRDDGDERHRIGERLLQIVPVEEQQEDRSPKRQGAER